jgi:hypothetical protein
MAIVRLSTAAQNAAANAIADLIDIGSGTPGGVIKLYTASMPATPEVAVSTQTLLATLTFSATAFGPASAGVVTAATITADTNASGSGTAAWARIFDKDGAVIMDVDVSETDATLILDNVVIAATQTVSLLSGMFTMPSGA